MASSIDVFKEKETNNWIKASIGINITKKGLTHFVETEMRKVHAAVGKGCGKCTIENLTPCPTKDLCKKKKRNICKFHKSHQPQQCQICYQVKHNIIAKHRYNNPSWKNTKAELWNTDWWEIAKCFLPPDGYLDVSAVQESDFNGVINVLLNCTHFDACLSTSCPLQKVRQIGRVLRHSKDCKVTDGHLQDYFQTLSLLLMDPSGLIYDKSAASALTKLIDLQNDRLSLTELCTLLREVQQTLANANKVGEKAKGTIVEGLKKIEELIQAGEKRINEKTVEAENKITDKTEVATNHIERKANESVDLIYERTQQLNKSLEDTSRKVENTILEQTTENTLKIEKIKIEAIKRILQAGNEKANYDYEKIEKYEKDVEAFQQRLKEHYNDISSNVPPSFLDQGIDTRITDIYATPKIYQIDIKKDGKRIKENQLLSYKDIFYKHDNLNRRIYLQGEPGSGKSTFSAKLVHDWCHEGNQPLSASSNKRSAFDDVLTIHKFKFLFFISLRDSRNQTDVTEMIKKQFIDKKYVDEKRDDVYKLLLQIIEKEVCLVVRDGLDEWIAPDDCNLAEPSMAGFPNNTCTVLTTTRPWKLADEHIRKSQIESLLEIEGISDPYTFTRTILRCIIDESKDLDETVSEFQTFVSDRNLRSLSYSPMLYTLTIYTWVDTIDKEEHMKGSSLCTIYTTFLESLFKKANSTPGKFNDSKTAPVKCFSSTRFMEPNIQYVEVISKAAFHLLFSLGKETSIVFNDDKLSYFVSDSEQDFFLKAGLISKRKTKQASDASISFIHKSMQEFLAAYHIARNKPLAHHKDAYLDISQVFKFLCGLDIDAANELSDIMDSCTVDDGTQSRFNSTLADIILAGYREAIANGNDGIKLKLSHFYIRHNKDLKDWQFIWTTNKYNALSLDVYADMQMDIDYSYTGISDFSCSDTDSSDSEKLDVDSLDSEKFDKDSPDSKKLDEDSPDSKKLDVYFCDSKKLDEDSSDSKKLDKDSHDSATLEKDSPDSNTSDKDSSDRKQLDVHSPERAKLDIDSPERATLNKDSLDSENLNIDSSVSKQLERDYDRKQLNINSSDSEQLDIDYFDSGQLDVDSSDNQQLDIDFSDSGQFDTDSPESDTFSTCAKPIELDISNCLTLKSLTLGGNGILVTDRAKPATSKFPVWIVVNSKDPVLPSLEALTAYDVKWSSRRCWNAVMGKAKKKQR